MNNQFGNFLNFMQQVGQLRQTFSGNPQQEVQNLLNSGKVSQSLFNERYQQAQQAMQMMQMFFGRR